MSDDAFRLTALDARRYDFGNALRGYDRTRVDQFRDQVAEELERLSRANQELEVKARNFHEQLRAFRERDKALNDALISAQQLRGEIREQAQREAALIIREAQGEAERSLETLRSDIRRGEDELQQLWRNRRSYLAQLRSLMDREMADLDNADSAPPPTGVASRATDHPPAARREAAREATAGQPREVLREPARNGPREPGGEARSEPLSESSHERPREAPRDQLGGALRERPGDALRDQLIEAPRDQLIEAPRDRLTEAQSEPAREPSSALSRSDFPESARQRAATSEPDAVRDIPRELVREFTNDMTQGFREQPRDTSENARESARTGFRQPWASSARDKAHDTRRAASDDEPIEPARLMPPGAPPSTMESSKDWAQFKTNGDADAPRIESANERMHAPFDERTNEREREQDEDRPKDRGHDRLRETPGPRPSLPTPSWLDVVEDE